MFKRLRRRWRGSEVARLCASTDGGEILVTDIVRASFATEALPVAVDGGFGDVAQHAQTLFDQIAAAS